MRPQAASWFALSPLSGAGCFGLDRSSTTVRAGRRGRTQLFNVNENEKVCQILSLVPPEGLPSDYAVTWEGHLLHLNRTLSSYGIREDHIIQVVGAPRVRGTQQRHRRQRQMANAITQFQEQQEREALPDDDETEPTTFSTAHSYAATLLAAQAATDAAEMWSTTSAGRPNKKRKVRP